MIICWFCHNSQYSGVPCDKHMELPTLTRSPDHYADDPECGGEQE